MFSLVTVNSCVTGHIVRLPPDVCFCEEPQIVCWDYTKKQWKTDGFMDKLYNEGRLNQATLIVAKMA